MSKPNVREDLCAEWLKPDKVVRDPVHGDIFLTKAEVRIVDTSTFQRLRFIRQLGTSYYVFPGAEHSRFQHALGTLAMADRIATSINANVKGARSLTNEERFVVRIAALLHDIPHIPFGHTLEDELCCIDEDHDGRFSEFIGPGTQIGNVLDEYGVLRDVAEVLCAKPAPKGYTVQPLEPDRDPFKPLFVEQLAKPFMADIVKNTICADLLDYAARDCYFAGIRQFYDSRLFSYFEIDETSRVALRLQNRSDVRRGVVSEVLHLLRVRYTLGERVYYHHVKMITSAMLARAFLEAGVSARDFYELGDERALALIEEVGAKSGTDAGRRAAAMVGMLRSRRLYKPVYVVGRKLDDGEITRLVHQYLRGPDKTPKARERTELENEIAAECELMPGQVLVYCTSDRMSLKEARVRVRWADGFVKPLDEVADEPVRREISEITAKHRALWRFYVLVHPEVPEDFLQRVSDFAYEKFGHLNDMVEFTKTITPTSMHNLKQASYELNLTTRKSDELAEYARRRVARNEPEPRTVGEWKDLHAGMEAEANQPDGGATGGARRPSAERHSAVDSSGRESGSAQGSLLPPEE